MSSQDSENQQLQPLPLSQLTTRDQVLLTGISEYQRYINDWAKKKGFWKFTADFPNGELTLTKVLPNDHYLVKSTKLMLIVSELGECLEAIRKSDSANEVEELADAFIRLLDYCGEYGIDLGNAVVSKMLVNEGRPHKHGKVF